VERRRGAAEAERRIAAAGSGCGHLEAYLLAWKRRSRFTAVAMPTIMAAGRAGGTAMDTRSRACHGKVAAAAQRMRARGNAACHCHGDEHKSDEAVAVTGQRLLTEDGRRALQAMISRQADINRALATAAAARLTSSTSSASLCSFRRVGETMWTS